MTGAGRSRLRRALTVTSAYLALAVVATRPLVARLGDRVPHDLTDPLLNTWLLWWNAHVVPFGSRWWNGPFFHPAPGTLSFSESLVGLSALTTPLQWLGTTPLAAYNLAFILSFALSALTAHLLARALGLASGPSLVVGLAYGFAPYRVAHLAHLQILSAYFIPLVFLGVHRFADTGRRRWLALFALAWVLQGLTNGYFMVFVSVLLGVWLLWFLPSLPVRRWIAIVGAWALALLCLSPVLVQYARWHARYGFTRRVEEVEAFSANLLGLIAPPPGLAHWPSLVHVPPESWLFPGLVLPALVAAWAWSRYRAHRAGPASRLATAFAALAAAAAATAALSAMIGPWRVELAGQALSVKALGKPLSLAFYALLLAALASRTLRGAWRRGSVGTFYAVAAAVAVVLALGPNPVAGDLRIWDKAPYFFLLKLPGLLALRSPARFGMLAAFALALAGGFAVAWLVARRRRAGLLVALAACGVLYDGWPDRIPLLAAPSPLEVPAAAAAVLELPLGEARDAAAMFRQIGHGVPVLNGYSGHHAPSYHALRLGIERLESGLLDAISEHGPVLVALEAPAGTAAAPDPGPGPLEDLLRAQPGTQVLPPQGDRRLFLVRRTSPPPAPALGDRIGLTLLRSSAARAVYELGPGGPLAGLVLSFGIGVSSLPAGLTIETAETPGRWTTVWADRLAGPAFRAALRDPGRVPVTIETPRAAGRLLRVQTHGVWTIETIDAFAAAAPPPAATPRALEPRTPGPRAAASGDELVYEQGRGEARDLFVIPAGGGVPRRLTTHPAQDGLPRWTADGAAVLFTSRRSGEWQLWRVPSDGGEPSRVRANAHVEWQADPSPDGRWLAFLSNADAAEHLWLRDEQRGTLRALVRHGPRAILGNPDWSPDGRRMTFSSNHAEGHQIYVVDVETGEARRISPVGGCEPRWSPDGQRIAYVGRRPRRDRSEILEHDLSSGREKVLVAWPALNYDPAYSPDGSEIAFASTVTGGWEIHRQRLSDGKAWRVTFAGEDARYPDYRPTPARD